ncbi:MAG: AmmeMemoRadiSam system protein A [Oscillospiraceae bacterium]|jgi:AmmeMemoRadiSam system protein A|nr:AmmeMemoRadiSam system protein A [Oscillospiraceae bacterium]
MLYGCLLPHPPLIVPAVGGAIDKVPATRAAYQKIASEIDKINPDVLVVFSPHSINYEDHFHISPGESASGSFEQFGAPKVKIKVLYDSQLAELIDKISQKNNVATDLRSEQDSSLDHGTMVPLNFLTCRKIVRIGLSDLSLVDHYRFGTCVKEAIKKLERNAVIVASGDMSHKLRADGAYGLVPEGAVHDEFVRNCLEEGDFCKLLTIDRSVAKTAAECGLRSLIMLAGTMDELSIASKIYNYEAPYGVGYLTAEVRGEKTIDSLLPTIILNEKTRLNAFTGQTEDEFVRLARQNIEHYVKTGEVMELPNNLPREMTHHRAGIFVSIKKNGNLRGCIGTISPTCDNIALEIIQNSVSACSCDPRFEPVTVDELPSLVCSVDVLMKPEPILDKNKLNPKRYGVIVAHESRRGLLLPNLEKVNTIEEQIEIALRKGGINESEPYSIERFEVIRHK